MNLIQQPISTIQLSIKLDLLKGSVNAMLIPAKGFTANGKKRLIFAGGYRKQKEKVTKYLHENYKTLEDCMINKPEFYFTTVSYVVYDHWLTKCSEYMKLRKKDVSNFTKGSEDVIFKFLGLEDETIIYSTVEKGLLKPLETPQLHCNIEVYEMDTSIFKRLTGQNKEK